MSVRTIKTSAFSSGLPSVPFTSPSMVVTWAKDWRASSRAPAAATAKLRNFIVFLPGTLIISQMGISPARIGWTVLFVEQPSLLPGDRFGRLPSCQRTADHSQHLDRLERRPRHKHPLLVPVGVRRDHRESGGLHQKEVVGEDAFHQLTVPEAQAHPESPHFGAGLEGPALRLERREFADERDRL